MDFLIHLRPIDFFASIKGTIYRFIVSIYNRYILQRPEYGRAHRQ